MESPVKQHGGLGIILPGFTENHLAVKIFFARDALPFPSPRAGKRPPRVVPLPRRKIVTHTLIDYAAPPMETVRLGFLGVGGRGNSLLSEFLKTDGVAVNAIYDTRPVQAERAAKRVADAGLPPPQIYTGGPDDLQRLCARPDLDAVVIATPWERHAPMALEAMNAGLHAFIEVPAAVTLEECWALVDTAEATQRHCMMLENCCYGETELMVLNMARQGLLGELLHAEGAYLHDLRSELLSGADGRRWRLQHSVNRCGNLYPTHGLGPIAQVFGINRGDQFDYLVSMSAPARGLSLYAAQKFGPEDPRAKTPYQNGDMNTSLIKTVQGRTLMIQHDTENPRPYDRLNLIQGTNGVVRSFPDRIYIDGRSPWEEWEDLDAYRGEYEHPLWAKIGELANWRKPTAATAAWTS